MTRLPLKGDLLKHLLFLFLIFTSMRSFATCNPSAFDCDFYQCMEEQYHCGRFSGYFLSYGKRYCELIHKAIDRKGFSTKAKEWIEGTTYCLQEKLITSDSSTCKDFKKASVGHHVDCYVENGFCELSDKDKRKIFMTFWSAAFRLRYTIPTLKGLREKCGR